MPLEAKRFNEKISAHRPAAKWHRFACNDGPSIFSPLAAQASCPLNFFRSGPH